MHPFVNTAVKAARKAGAIIVRHMDQLDQITVEAKGRNDFVSSVDRLAEEEIIYTIASTYPEHSILAEEGGLQGEHDYQWIIDPLDGTTNFLHGFPQYAVSIAVKNKNTIEHGVIFDPLRNELFTASRGSGARLNDTRIRVSNVTALQRSLIGTGFPFRQDKDVQSYLSCLQEVMENSHGIRRAGSAALDLAYVACGRLDGFWEADLNAWDLAAGCLIIQEAGGLISDFEGEDNHLDTGNIIAANPKIFIALTKIIRKRLKAGR